MNPVHVVRLSFIVDIREKRIYSTYTLVRILYLYYKNGGGGGEGFEQVNACEMNG